METGNPTPGQLKHMAQDGRDPVEPDSPRRGSVEELFATLESPLLRYALRLTAGRAPAEDVVQEAFMRLHAQFDEIREPRRWLYRTVHNLAFNQRRAASKVVALDPTPDGTAPGGQDSVDPRPLPDEQIARWEHIGLVRLSLEALDARSREVVRLKFQEDLSYKQISQRTGLKVGHVGYLLHHALKAVADELAKTGGLQ
jgi:RNA polymerase sigma-70 factor (ECF subfamily)